MWSLTFISNESKNPTSAICLFLYTCVCLYIHIHTYSFFNFLHMDRTGTSMENRWTLCTYLLWLAMTQQQWLSQINKSWLFPCQTIKVICWMRPCQHNRQEKVVCYWQLSTVGKQLLLSFSEDQDTPMEPWTVLW